MKPTKIMLIVLVLLTILAVAYFMLKPTHQPQNDIHDEIKRNSDSVAVASVTQSDTVKLRKLKELKIRIATARYNDSLQRAKDK